MSGSASGLIEALEPPARGGMRADRAVGLLGRRAVGLWGDAGGRAVRLSGRQIMRVGESIFQKLCAHSVGGATLILLGQLLAVFE